MRTQPARPARRFIRTSTFAALLAVLVIYDGPVADATRGLIALPALVRRAAPPVQWEGTVAAGGVLEIKGASGPIHASPADAERAQVVALRTARRDDPSLVRIVTVPHAGGVTVCALYPQSGATDEPCTPGDDPERQVRQERVRVAFSVRVPANVRFVGRTVDGDITTDRLAGPVALSSINGAISFATGSYGEAQTVNGSIRASLGAADWRDTLRFETVNGSIAVDLPAGADTDVYAHARHGEATFGPALSPAPSGRRAVTSRLGRGGRTLALRTVNGSIRVRR